MSTLNEITKLIVSKSKNAVEINKKIKDKEHLEEWTYLPKCFKSDETKVSLSLDVARFITSVHTEIMRKDRANVGNTREYFDLETNSDFASSRTYSIFTRFLNNFDKEASVLLPLLNSLKEAKADDMAVTLFEELRKVGREWHEIESKADTYLNLQLLHADEKEIESFRNLTMLGFLHMNTFEKKILNPIFFHVVKDTSSEYITSQYSHSINFSVKTNPHSHILCNGDDFFLIGIDDRNRFVCEKLDREVDFNGFAIDFTSVSKDSEKIEMCKSILEMFYLGDTLTHKTEQMTAKESVLFAIECVKQKSKNLFESTGSKLEPDKALDFLKSFSSDIDSKESKLFTFNEIGIKALKHFSQNVRGEHLIDIKFDSIIKAIDTTGLNNITIDHLDLWTNHPKILNPSPAVMKVDDLVYDYVYKEKTNPELLKTAKSLNDYELLLVETRLKLLGITPQRFQNDITQAQKNKLRRTI